MTDEQIQALLMNRYTILPEKDKEAIREIFYDEKAGRVIRKFIGGKIANNFKLRKPLSMQEGDRVPQAPATMQAPKYIGGYNPQATPQQTIADDKPMDAKEGDYIINAAAAEFAGKQDIEKMINSAVTSLQEKGVDLRFGNPKMNIGETVKLLVSQNEVYIPKEIAKEIGYDRLGKINNRGKEHTRKIQKETGKATGAYQGGFVKKALGEEVKNNNVQPVGFIDDAERFIQDKILPLFGIGGQDDIPTDKLIKPKSTTPPTKELKTEENLGFVPTPPVMPKGMREERTRVNETLRLTEGAVSLSEGPIKTTPYIPRDKKNQIIGVSGVTIGRGVDLGQHSIDTLKDAGFTDDLINRFKPFLGLKKENAQKALDKAKRNKTPLYVTQDEARFISDQMLQYKIDEYNRVFKSFKNVLDPKIKAVLAAEHFAGRLGLPAYSKFKKALKDTNYNLERAYSIGVLNNRDPKIKSFMKNAAENLLNWYKNTSGVEIKTVDPKQIQIEKKLPKKEFKVPDTDKEGKPVERIKI